MAGATICGWCLVDDCYHCPVSINDKTTCKCECNTVASNKKPRPRQWPGDR